MGRTLRAAASKVEESIPISFQWYRRRGLTASPRTLVGAFLLRSSSANSVRGSVQLARLHFSPSSLVGERLERFTIHHIRRDAARRAVKIPGATDPSYVVCEGDTAVREESVARW